MPDIKFPAALVGGRLVFIGEYDGGIAHCVDTHACGRELIAKRGLIRQPHFAHPSGGCFGEGLVHKTTRLLIKQTFEELKKLGLSYELQWQCPSCSTAQSLDITAIAERCETEWAGLSGARADLAFLTSSGECVAVIEVVDTHNLDPRTNEVFKAADVHVFKTYPTVGTLERYKQVVVAAELAGSSSGNDGNCQPCKTLAARKDFYENACDALLTDGVPIHSVHILRARRRHHSWSLHYETVMRVTPTPEMLRGFIETLGFKRLSRRSDATWTASKTVNGHDVVLQVRPQNGDVIEAYIESASPEFRFQMSSALNWFLTWLRCDWNLSDDVAPPPPTVAREKPLERKPEREHEGHPADGARPLPSDEDATQLAFVMPSKESNPTAPRKPGPSIGVADALAAAATVVVAKKAVNALRRIMAGSATDGPKSVRRRSHHPKVRKPSPGRMTRAGRRRV